MLITFRTDASLTIGTGHVMRCLTLATQLKNLGAQCQFICRPHVGNLIHHVKERGFITYELPLASSDVNKIADSIYSNWLGASQQDDALQTTEILESIKPDWVVVDHYALDTSWERLVAPHAEKLLVIDDLANRNHLCDVLLDQNLGRKTEDYAPLVPKDCIVFAGPQHALLRPEFSTLREYSLSRRRKTALNNLMITMGGVDQHNVTGSVLDALESCSLPKNCEITVVLGQHSPWQQHIRTQAATMPWNTEVKISAQNMAELMAKSDLAIGAAGSTAWERCCLGLPSISLILADNQMSGAHALELSGATRILRDCQANALQALLADITSNDSLSFMSKRAATITDGTGAQKIAQQLWTMSHG